MRRLRCFLAILIAAVSIAACATTYENPIVRQETVTRGQWFKGHTLARLEAERRGAPFLSFAGRETCGHCHDCEVAMTTSRFLEWQKRANIYLGLAMAGDEIPAEYNAAIAFSKGPQKIKAELPYLCLYWKKADGTVHKYNFCGQKKEIPASGDTLADILVNFLDAKLNEWGYSPPKGSRFACGNTVGDRLEVQVGFTTVVEVPVTRETGADSSIQDTFTAVYPDKTEFTTNLVWNEGETFKSVPLPVPPDVQVSDTIQLTLDCQGIAQMSSVTVVNRGNSAKNPTWKGVAGFGEWTMDLEAARTFVSEFRKAHPNEKAYLLVLVGGSLWCPDCARTSANLDDTPEFKAWAEANNVVCAVVDIPNFSAASPETGPCLLTYEAKNVSQSYIDADLEHGATQSGAGYLSRWMIPAEEARERLAANRILVGTSTDEGGWNRPERTNRYRTGVPIFIVLNPAGSIAARLETFASKSPTVFLPGYITRLDELLAAADSEVVEDNVNWSTTKETLSVTEGGTYAASVSGGDLVDVVELADVDDTARTHLDLSATIPEGLGLSVSLLQVSPEGSESVVSNMGLTAAIPSGRVSADFCHAGDGIRRFVRIALTGLEPDEGATRFGRAGSAAAAYSLLGSTESIPGKILFKETAQSVFVPDGRGVVTVMRVGGRSGSMTARLYVKDGGSAEGLYEFPETNLVWKTGEVDDKSIAFNVWRREALATGTFTLALEAVDASGEPVSSQEHTVTLTDTAEPCFEELTIRRKMYSGFAVDETLRLRNVRTDASVLLKRIKGNLPSGIKLRYDRKTGAVVLSGTPTKPGVYSATYTVAQGRITGLPATLSFDISDPRAVNQNVGVKHVAQQIPLVGTMRGTNILEGILTFTISAKNKISAKHVGMLAKIASYSGSWQTLDPETACVAATLAARDGSLLYLEMDGDGTVSAEIPSLGVTGWATKASVDFAAWAGHYTLTFPAIDEGSTIGTATGVLDVQKTGKAKWSVTLSDGKVLKSTASLTALSSDMAVVALYNQSKWNGFGALVEISSDGVHAWDKSTGAYGPQIIHNALETVALEVHDGEAGTPRYAFGSWYKAGIAPNELSVVFGYADEYLFSSPVLTERVLIATSKTFLPQEAGKEFKFTFKSESGAFSGWADVLSSSGKPVKAKFSGVLMPGWDECGACVEGFTAWERPFGSGTLFYKDGGVVQSYPVDLHFRAVEGGR